MTRTTINASRAIRPHHLLLGAGLTVALILPGPISAQPARAKPVGEMVASLAISSAQESTVEVIPLRHTQAKHAAGILHRLAPDDVIITVDERTNALIVAGSQDAQDFVRELVAQLDVEIDAEKAAGRNLVRVYELSANTDRHRAQMLGSLFDLLVAYDQATNQMIVRGPAHEIESLDALIETIDRLPAADAHRPSELRVRLAWLVSGLDQGAGTKIPPDMGEVIRELDKLGIDELRLAAQTIVRVSADQRFRTQFVANLIEPWSMSFTGHTANGPGGAVTLDLKLHGERLSGTASSKLETSISTVSGHFVVLGVSPIQNLKSVFVIQVTDMK